MHGFTGAPFLGCCIKKVWSLIKVLIPFKVAFIQAFLTSAGDLVTSTGFLGYGIKWGIYEPGYPKADNELFNYFTATLKNLCKPFPTIFTDSSDTFY